MNSFLELYTSSDYLDIYKPYYAGVWEPTIGASDYLIPFQLTGNSSDVVIYKVQSGVETDITNYFKTANKLNDWTLTGTGPFSNTGATINSWTIEDSDYITSNQFTLRTGHRVEIVLDDSKFGSTPADIDVYLLKGVATIWSGTVADFSASVFVDIATTGTDYTIKIENDSGSAYTASASTPIVRELNLIYSNGYTWYDGSQLSTTITGIYSLKVVENANTYWTNYIEACGFADKLKYLVSSLYDFGGIKYVSGYEQYIYKNAVVTRSPRSEIEITGDLKNGKVIVEKTVSSIRYVIKMKVTESEYEAFVHSLGGTVTITDVNGKTYTAVNIEVSNPAWYRSNGIMELTFVDENNINVWTKNNTAL